jgi:signal transduction histidine kinase
MLGHELRNPLAPLTNAVRYIGRQAEQDAPSRAVASMADRQLRQLARLVDDLLEVSRITQGRIELRKAPARIGAVVRSAVEAALP